MLLDNQIAEELDSIRRQLHLESFSLPDQMKRLTRYESDLVSEFGESDFSDKSYSERLRMIQSDPAFQSWEHTRDTSGMLIFSGLNEVPDATHCWVSAVALKLIVELTSSGSSQASDKALGAQLDVCVFHVTVSSEQCSSFQHVMAVLIHQLLLARKRVLHQEELKAKLRDNLQRYLDVLNQGQVAFSRVQDPLEGLLLTCLSFYADGKTTVWIVVDRADRCRGTNRRKGWDVHRLALLRALARAVRKTSARVKILVTVSAVDWDVESCSRDLDFYAGGSIVMRLFREEEAG